MNLANQYVVGEQEEAESYVYQLQKEIASSAGKR